MLACETFLLQIALYLTFMITLHWDAIYMGARIVPLWLFSQPGHTQTDTRIFMKNVKCACLAKTMEFKPCLDTSSSLY